MNEVAGFKRLNCSILSLPACSTFIELRQTTRTGISREIIKFEVLRMSLLAKYRS